MVRGGEKQAGVLEIGRCVRMGSSIRGEGRGQGGRRVHEQGGRWGTVN